MFQTQSGLSCLDNGVHTLRNIKGKIYLGDKKDAIYKANETNTSVNDCSKFP